jgi:bifunctional enzyme CysN/CysC
VVTPFEECARRDTKGLYARALKGEIKNFTGVDSPYEAPENPEIHLTTLGRSAEEMVETLEQWLIERDSAQDQYDGGGI